MSPSSAMSPGFQPGADQSMGFIFIRLKPPKERAGRLPIEQVAQKFMGQLAALPDGLCALHAMPVLKISSGADPTAVGSDYAYMLTGLDRDEVYATARQLEQEIRGVRRRHAFRRAEQRQAQHAAPQYGD